MLEDGTSEIPADPSERKNFLKFIDPTSGEESMVLLQATPFEDLEKDPGIRIFELTDLNGLADQNGNLISNSIDDLLVIFNYSIE